MLFCWIKDQPNTSISAAEAELTYAYYLLFVSNAAT